ncbi:hypothetical protein SELMODRAFT_426362 [Selaginella moellendorffii]|uniref:Pentacotripeptide-repeat region of PRORP domain-containing protein n=1 Tax=Selaginella moellendorffii TaxID=88036 RepID=D8SW51_SELML|nr:hypothetical protein SELMODRAFT_426362 [Selaginella moellendorffii]
MAKHGDWSSGFDLYRAMILEGVRPNDVTFTNMLFLCTAVVAIENAASGMLAHRSCSNSASRSRPIVDVLGRSGRLEEAEEFVEKGMGFEPGILEYRTLLRSCMVVCEMAQRVMEIESQTFMAYAKTLAYRKIIQIFQLLMLKEQENNKEALEFGGYGEFQRESSRSWDTRFANQEFVWSDGVADCYVNGRSLYSAIPNMLQYVPV